MALLQEPAYHRSLRERPVKKPHKVFQLFLSAPELMSSPQPEHIPLACLQPLDLLEQPQVMPLTTQTALPPTPLRNQLRAHFGHFSGQPGRIQLIFGSVTL